MGIYSWPIPPKECVERSVGGGCGRYGVDGNCLLGGDIRAGAAPGYHARGDVDCMCKRIGVVNCDYMALRLCVNQ